MQVITDAQDALLLALRCMGCKCHILSKSVHACRSYSKPKVGCFWGDTTYPVPV